MSEKRPSILYRYHNINLVLENIRQLEHRKNVNVADNRTYFFCSYEKKFHINKKIFLQYVAVLFHKVDPLPVQKAENNNWKYG